MLRSPLRPRVIAPLALAVLTLGMPAAAVAETTPSPSSTASASAEPSATQSASATPSSTPSTTGSAGPVPSSSAPSPTVPAPAESTPSAATTPSAPAETSAARLAAAAPIVSAVRIGIAQEQQAKYAAHFLATQLAATENHLNYPESEWGISPDPGNTIDAVLALDATGTGATAAEAATDWVEENVSDYIEYPGTPVAGGATGKALILAAVQGRDTRAFGKKDLVGELEKLLTAEGRFGTEDNDYAVTINQALAIIGLHRADVPVPPASVTFLAAQQCADGGVRGTIGAATCTSDPDATAFAAQAFLAAGDRARAAKALDHLTSRQRADGALTNASGEGANANTTGVAAQAFALGGRGTAYQRAAGFLLGLQWGCAAPTQYRGGIAFTMDTRATTTANLERAIRATPQATLGLMAGSLVTVDAEGLQTGTVATPCAAASPTVTAMPSNAPTNTPAGAGPSGSADGNLGTDGTDGTDGPVAGSDTPANDPGLAYTGAEPTLPLMIATLLLLTGAATILVARRRGAHQ